MYRSALFILLIAALPIVIHQRLAARTQSQMPVLQVDPYWPQLPENWIIGVGAGIATDAENNVWIIHRPGTVTEKRACCKAAPVVMEFSPSGKLLQSWNGAGEGYEWPLEKDEHGIFVDYKNNVWIAGRGTAFASVPVRNGTSENQILKFDNKGKFLLQIGRRGKGTGSNDTANLGQPADIVVYPPTNEVFVADGYGNRRVIVFDADTGAFKRMWGAFGNPPLDNVPAPPKVAEGDRIPAKEQTGPGPLQFVQPVHAVRVSNDGLVYVSDRGGKRVQVFTLDGKFVMQRFIDRYCEAPHCGNGQTVASTAFSNDPEQQFLYVASRSPARVWILDRKTLEPLDSFGRNGVAPGEFYVMHHMNVDAKGNLYVTEVQDGKRIQKFVFKGMVPAPTH